MNQLSPVPPSFDRLPIAIVMQIVAFSICAVLLPAESLLPTLALKYPHIRIRQILEYDHYRRTFRSPDKLVLSADSANILKANYT